MTINIIILGLISILHPSNILIFYFSFYLDLVLHLVQIFKFWHAFQIKVRARLSNPLPKTQAVKGGMCGGFRIGHARSAAFSRPGNLGFSLTINLEPKLYC